MSQLGCGMATWRSGPITRWNPASGTSGTEPFIRRYARKSEQNSGSDLKAKTEKEKEENPQLRTQKLTPPLKVINLDW
jgi:hypothetical protein